MSEHPPRVSAIIITYQFERYIAQSIESVLAQDYPPELLEVIVIDDGSTDGTREAVAPYLDRVRYVHKENGGLLSSVNRGFAEEAPFAALGVAVHEGDHLLEGHVPGAVNLHHAVNTDRQNDGDQYVMTGTKSHGPLENLTT